MNISSKAQVNVSNGVLQMAEDASMDLCQKAQLNVHSRGVLELKENAILNLLPGAQMNITERGVVQLHENSRLTLSSNSQLTVNSRGVLSIDSDVTVQGNAILNDTVSVSGSISSPMENETHFSEYLIFYSSEDGKGNFFGLSYLCFLIILSLKIVFPTIDILCNVLTEFANQFDLLRTLEVALYRISALSKNLIGGFLRTTLKKKLLFETFNNAHFEPDKPDESAMFHYKRALLHTKISHQKSGHCVIFSYQKSAELIKITFSRLHFTVSEHLNLTYYAFIDALSNGKLYC